VKKAGYVKKKLVDKAKELSHDMVEQTEKVRSDVKNFREGKYSGTAEKIESEITRLRGAIKAAIESYKDTRKVRRIFPNEDKYYFTDFSDYLFDEDEDESQPKFESMKKRNRE
jgi:hypothetical protein